MVSLLLFSLILQLRSTQTKVEEDSEIRRVSVSNDADTKLSFSDPIVLISFLVFLFFLFFYSLKLHIFNYVANYKNQHECLIFSHRMLFPPHLFLLAVTDKALCYNRCRGKLLTLTLPTGPDPIYLTAAALALSLLTFCLLSTTHHAGF